MNIKTTLVAAAATGHPGRDFWLCEHAGRSDGPQRPQRRRDAVDGHYCSTGLRACKGQNGCKGQGGCKSDKNACKVERLQGPGRLPARLPDF